ncbi:N-acetyllactosaminide beta-1,3-N-acetylglucosaminyltransferase [Strongyloides ratti]|uniref:N-acetyllactosaminide beta-1,3-N-acetylglucosaminyltransferase n=1 Tax=Strongyloides ratti TaxID=34506 RepID=A0A090LKR0_STRRB|nr:N-acetyllactosaminide beta-1,3-N-acetylglucosaminyltransferase [Strongyloides ratti]CEF70293.1 N-acetyllactosaminide beta-1,3-N-acetylglucosaminyltransferase [Strongyloides ratti]
MTILFCIQNYIIVIIIYYLICYSKMSLVKVRVVESITYNNQYCVSFYYWKDSMKLSEGSSRITLVLHATTKYLHYLADQLTMWDGPISVAFFMPTPEISECILHKHKYCAMYNTTDILYFQLFSLFQHLYDIKKISLHFFFEKKDHKNCPHIILKGIKKPSGNILKKYKTMLSRVSEYKKFFNIYPINVARNIARLGKKTILFLSGDIENYPSLNYEKKVSKLAVQESLLKNNRKLVLVHRRFEINDSFTIPRTKDKLKELYDNNQAFVFHAKLIKKAHKIAKLDEWFDGNENMLKTRIGWIVGELNPYWEPQFVGNDQVPFHDERFPYRKRSNTHLVHVMCFQGFDFAIMDDVFTVHKGIKKALTKEEKAARKLNQKAYKKMVKEFNYILSTTYPNMTDKCKPLPN